VIHQAQQRGQLREDLTIDDLYLLMGTAPMELSSAARRRWLSLVTNGLKNMSSRKPALPVKSGGCLTP
jgi:hypothetical protein